MDSSPYRGMAQESLDSLYSAILFELTDNPAGLTNAEVAERLGLKSSHEGKQSDYLTYSLLGNLMKMNKVAKTKVRDRGRERTVYLTLRGEDGVND
jgi:hypothetical protein